MEKGRLVYSTDPALNKRCAKCKELEVSCTCKGEDAVPEKITVKLSIEKAQRGGKTVSVLRGLPRNEEFLTALEKELKKTLGVGGTHEFEGEGARIEIQGDKRDRIREILKKKGYVVKG